MIVWGFFVLIESSSEKCLANRWKTEDKRLYYVIKKGRVHYNSLKLVLGGLIYFFFPFIKSQTVSDMQRVWHSLVENHEKGRR